MCVVLVYVCERVYQLPTLFTSLPASFHPSFSIHTNATLKRTTDLNTNEAKRRSVRQRWSASWLELDFQPEEPRGREEAPEGGAAAAAAAAASSDWFGFN